MKFLVFVALATDTLNDTLKYPRLLQTPLDDAGLFMPYNHSLSDNHRRINTLFWISLRAPFIHFLRFQTVPFSRIKPPLTRIPPRLAGFFMSKQSQIVLLQPMFFVGISVGIRSKPIPTPSRYQHGTYQHGADRYQHQADQTRRNAD